LNATELWSGFNTIVIAKNKFFSAAALDFLLLLLMGQIGASHTIRRPLDCGTD
jgi:hypothetical protein